MSYFSKKLVRLSLMVLVIALFYFACQSKSDENWQNGQDTSMVRMSEKENGSFLSRQQLIDRLKRNRFDILIIGGGATGSGAALEAATRGLSTALVEANDYSAGTSSRSTKLVHGGVRYLETAVKHFDWQQYELVREALRERQRFLLNAPHLTNSLAILTPVYSWFEAIYYLAGLKLYDIMAGKASLGASEFLLKDNAIARFPTLKRSGLKGAVLYYDGQFDDARMNVSLILTAQREGAVPLNYVSVDSLIRENGKVVGAMVLDQETNQSWPVLAKVVVNATGAFADTVRKMDNPEAADIMIPSQGSHVLLPKSFSSIKDGLIIPKTKDGRVIFLLPWLGKTLAGTTDQAENITMLPRASEEEVEYILEHVRHYLDVPVKRSDVLATWSGLRPLVKPKTNTLNTAAISRDHIIDVSPARLITIVGGKWTTYRKMAEDVVDVAISVGKLSPLNGSVTKDLKLLGARHYKPSLARELALFERLPEDIAEHLAKSYGDRVDAVIDVDNKSKRARLVEGFPYIEAEVIYAVTHEHALHATDVIARRMRLAFLDNHAARLALPKVISIMGKQLKWDRDRMHAEMERGTAFLDTMFTKPSK